MVYSACQQCSQKSLILLKILLGHPHSARMLKCWNFRPFRPYLFSQLQKRSWAYSLKTNQIHVFIIHSKILIHLIFNVSVLQPLNNQINHKVYSTCFLFSFNFFLQLLLCISLLPLIFPFSAHFLLENALFCPQNARLKNRLSCSKFCQQNLSKPTLEQISSTT